MSPVASSGDDNETNGQNFPGGLKKVHKVGIGAIVIEEVMRIEGTKEADIEKRGVPSVSNKPFHGTPAPPQSRRSPPTPQAHKEVRMHPHTNTSGVPSGMYSPKGRTVWSRRPPTSGASGGSGGGGGLNDSKSMTSFMAQIDRKYKTVVKTVKLYAQSFKLIKWNEMFISVDQSFYWRRSIVWANDDGGNLKQHVIAKYSSMSVLSTLLLSSEVSVLFSPSDVLTSIRLEAFSAANFTLEFMIVFFLSLSIFLTIGTIMATFTAWSIVGAVSERNIHCILRSAIGLYTTQLPTTLLTCSLFTFLTWMLLLLYKILPTPFPIILTALTMIFIIHMVTTFSIFGRIILHSNAMSDVGVFSRSVEEGMLPVSLFQGLLDKTEGNRHVPVSLQYRRNLREALRKGEDETVIERHRRRHTIGGGEGRGTFSKNRSGWTTGGEEESKTGRGEKEEDEEVWRRGIRSSSKREDYGGGGGGGWEGEEEEKGGVPRKIEMVGQGGYNKFSALEWEGETTPSSRGGGGGRV
ncbi:hypothetical protein TrCOL_g1204 [Triparma columacea]|uniref:Uncharacterized protein n=1 Tax=Triparma columacea TaxID=722753 RepID=A0A9W7G4F3_9STRA|nr:hypothetical protein TrCOL_g1204 [Triparma columacea]